MLGGSNVASYQNECKNNDLFSYVALHALNEEITGPQQTSKPRPEPVIIAIKEPIQDPRENCAVVVGGRLLLSLWGGQAETRKGEETRVKRPLGGTASWRHRLQDVKHDTVIVIN